jgi:hypothetical protein
VARGGIEPPTQGFSTLKTLFSTVETLLNPCRQTYCPIHT